jgi:hypothetical protein
VIFVEGSRRAERRVMTLLLLSLMAKERFWRIFISCLIFYGLVGLRSLMAQREAVGMFSL